MYCRPEIQCSAVILTIKSIYKTISTKKVLSIKCEYRGKTIEDFWRISTEFLGFMQKLYIVEHKIRFPLHCIIYKAIVVRLGRVYIRHQLFLQEGIIDIISIEFHPKRICSSVHHHYCLDRINNISLCSDNLTSSNRGRQKQHQYANRIF